MSDKTWLPIETVRQTTDFDLTAFDKRFRGGEIIKVRGRRDGVPEEAYVTWTQEGDEPPQWSEFLQGPLEWRPEEWRPIKADEKQSLLERSQLFDKMPD